MAEAGKLRVAGHAVSSASQPLFDSWRCSWSIFKHPGQEGEREEEKEGEAGRGWDWIRPRGCEKQVKSSRRSLLREDSQKPRRLHKQGSQSRGWELGHRLLLVRRVQSPGDGTLEGWGSRSLRTTQGPDTWGRQWLLIPRQLLWLTSAIWGQQWSKAASNRNATISCLPRGREGTLSHFHTHRVMTRVICWRLYIDTALTFLYHKPHQNQGETSMKADGEFISE